ncbi:hypothetical protein NYR54_09855 [Chelativorans sp. SCAU2101]|jgi:Predicted secreted (periplasmic) protein|uniref:Cell division protein FtsL n=1 Tax=Chelativorans petroleitrophicus TaxID=2975484 RepID=A0A9X3B6L1_9HYPH|nr:hypothetical protein [Chelativorans petroleitrophicus]MCT8990592.1 hypothetical protein [Chelativorans petroleitrophicus]
MFRTSDVILIAVMLSAAAFTYKTKHDAQAMMNRIEALETRIQLEKDAIDVLKADWSLLTQPARLEKLAQVYKDELGLDVIKPEQIEEPMALGGIPFRKVTVEELIAGTYALSGEELQDPTVTGGVRP